MTGWGAAAPPLPATAAPMPTLDATEPYPWPFDGCLDPTRLAFVVAGAQAAWMAASPNAAPVAARITEVADALRVAGATVVLVHHVRRSATFRPSPFPPSVGQAAAALVGIGGPGDVVVRSSGIDGFFGGPLDTELRGRGIDRLVLGGFGAEACVDSTLRSANDRGYECLTLVDAVAPFSADLGRHALGSITMSGGIFGAVGSSAALLAALAPARSPVPVEAP